MIVDTWRVVMYGTDCSDLELTEKAKKEFESNFCDSAFLNEVIPLGSFLSWGTDGSGSYYIGLVPRYPWEKCDKWINLDQYDVKEETRRILAPHVTSVDDLNFEEIDTEGWD